MQPTAAAAVPPNGDMDLQTMQSMDWLFKKERIYLLAQFWQQRATLAEKEVSTLKEQLSSNPTNNCESKDSGNMDRQSYESEIATKDKEIKQLVEDVQRLQGCLTKLQESSINQISRLEEQLEQKRQHIARLETKLDQQRDYEDIKREISILRSDNPEAKNLELLLEKSKQQEAGAKTPVQDPEGAAAASEAPPAIQSPPSALPAPFQNVEQFGSMLGEEIVSNWRRSIEHISRLTPNHSVDAPAKPATPTAADSTEKSAASTPQPEGELRRSPDALLNGNPKSPEDNNNHHLSNNNIPLASPMCANFLRSEDSLKSPFRFEDHPRSFRFAEELGMGPGSMVSRLGESLIPKGDPMEAKLQEMLRYNMDKYASQNLDTLHIARRVRELLSIHNIGQRLFAKYVLGLSQGTVSELLSKPKPWDKLTEKGRDSYRKMHAWACDDNAIMLLKSLIPKKDSFSTGKETGLPSFPSGTPRPDAADLTEERIAHILSEASQLQQLKNHPDDSHSNEDSKSPHACPSPYPKESSLSKRLKKYENDDISQEKVARIYQEEFAKLMSRNSRDAFPSNLMDRTQEEIRMALDAYQREVAKFNQGQNPALGLLLQQQALAQHQHAANGGVQDLSIPKDKKNGNGEDKDKEDYSSAFSLVRPKLEASQNTNSSASSPLGNSILPPMTPSEDFSSSAAASPLQRMASITNSLISQPPAQPHSTSTQRPLKAVLPPITQQQFDLYNNLNTEDIVKKVKEQLSQYSISQRLFGESVLGLSQGSVSDLLARPKPWHMLTQKGREPFIRMKMFLEDENAVHKLVASQYKIAPEKLMRTGGYGGSCQVISKNLPQAPKMMSEALLNKMENQPYPNLQLGPPHQPPPPPMLLASPNLNHMAQDIKKSSSPLLHSPMGQHRNMHMSPSVYEMAALTQDLDTQVITTKIKEALLANNIGQKIFGEAVLGLSQGSVSELLSKPKPWHMLSIKGREPFIRMQLWLNDAHNVDRLQALKNERREANKRRRSSGPGAHDNSSDTSSNDTSEFYHSNSPGPGPPSAKKQRVLFSEEQKEALRIAFTLDPYPNVATIEFLASELGLSSRTITNWFHNHRMRLKQQVPHGVPADVPPRDQSSQAPFDPVQFRLILNQRLLELSKERMGLGGVPLPYPPYLAANTNLAALISRGLLPSGDVDLNALNAVKEQISGLDLSMTGLKREPDFDDEDVESNLGSEDSNISDGLQQVKLEQKEVAVSSRSSRRKPAAPQWVNPDWQDDKKGDEVIINGVCVMQTDYRGRDDQETVRVEPTAVLDKFEDDRSEASSESEEKEQEEEAEPEVKQEEKKEGEEERWQDY